MSLYLGLDSSTQSLTAIVIEANDCGTSILFERSFAFDEVLPRYGTVHGVLPSADPHLAVSSPLMWADALDVMLGAIASSGIDLDDLAAICGAAQQHGSVYLNGRAPALLPLLDPCQPPAKQLEPCLARPVAPIWMDTSTSLECEEITAAVGGSRVLAERTGSRAFERFTGPQIRKFFKSEPDAYRATTAIHLVSSFLATLLAGHHAPVDPGDGSGTNLMELASNTWWAPALAATAPQLEVRLPQIAPSWTIAGALSPYWQRRHGLPPARVVVWSGDNPCSLVGTGLIDEHVAAVSLGTSDTIFSLMREPGAGADATGHVFGAPNGGFMGLTCFANGSIARERVRDQFGLGWSEFSAILETTAPGNAGRILLPWFLPEITPPVLTPGVHRHGLSVDDGPGHVRGVVEGQMLSMAIHSRWMQTEITTMHATGGASSNRAILQVMADVFGAEVRQFQVANSACLGAALRARHADAAASGTPIAWPEVVGSVVEQLVKARVRPDGRHRDIYRDLQRTYAEVEAAALSARR